LSGKVASGQEAKVDGLLATERLERLGQGGKRPGGETGSPVMRRRTSTSAPSALPVRFMATKNFLSTNRKSTLLSLFLSHQWRIFKSLFDAIDPKCNTYMSVYFVVWVLKTPCLSHFRRIKFHSIEKKAISLTL